MAAFRILYFRGGMLETWSILEAANVIEAIGKVPAGHARVELWHGAHRCAVLRPAGGRHRHDLGGPILAEDAPD